MYGDPRPLFIVTEIVITGLIIFVGYVLLRVKEPWTRSTSLAVSTASPELVAAAPLADEKIADEKIADDAKVEAEAQLDKPKND
jgi:hypothetical protein